MPRKPILTGLRLPPCCEQALREINDKSEIGRLLRIAVATGPFVTMFGAHPGDALFTIGDSDWDVLVRATKSVDSIVRNRCMTIAVLHSREHPGGDLYRFWVAMTEVFA